MIYQNLNTTKSELIVDFYLNFRCNFDCSYCCSSHDKLRYKEPEYPKSVEIYKEYITNIAKTQYSTCLCLLGGEPLLYRGLDEIIKHSQRYFKDIELYTNGSVLLSRLKCTFENVKVIISIHPSMYFKVREKIIQNIRFLQDHGFNYVVKLMLERKPKYCVDAYEVYKDLRPITTMIAGYIEDINTDTFNLTKDSCFDELRNVKSIKLDDTLMSEYNFIKLFLDGKTKERICYPNEVCIYPDGKITHLCIDTELESRGDHNLSRDKDYFKTFRIPKITCDRVCSYLDQRREF